MEHDDRLLNAREVAAFLGVSERWIRDAAREGRIPHVQLGRYRRFRREVVEKWLRDLEQEQHAA
jgi:excisionase family DNA binding protein